MGVESSTFAETDVHVAPNLSHRTCIVIALAAARAVGSHKVWTIGSRKVWTIPEAHQRNDSTGDAGCNRRYSCRKVWTIPDRPDAHQRDDCCNRRYRTTGDAGCNRRYSCGIDAATRNRSCVKTVSKELHKESNLGGYEPREAEPCRFSSSSCFSSSIWVRYDSSFFFAIVASSFSRLTESSLALVLVSATSAFNCFNMSITFKLQTAVPSELVIDACKALCRTSEVSNSRFFFSFFLVSLSTCACTVCAIKLESSLVCSFAVAVSNVLCKRAACISAVLLSRTSLLVMSLKTVRRSLDAVFSISALDLREAETWSATTFSRRNKSAVEVYV